MSCLAAIAAPELSSCYLSTWAVYLLSRYMSCLSAISVPELSSCYLVLELSKCYLWGCLGYNGMFLISNGGFQSPPSATPSPNTYRHPKKFPNTPPPPPSPVYPLPTITATPSPYPIPIYQIIFWGGGVAVSKCRGLWRHGFASRYYCKIKPAKADKT